MPIQIREEDSRLYVKVLIGFSIVQVLLAMILFVYLNASPALWGVLAAAVVLGIFLIHKFWDEKKPVRLVTRVVEYAAVLLPLLLFIVTLIMSLVEARGELHPQEWGILLFNPVRHYPYLSGVYAAADGGFRHPRPPFRRGEACGSFPSPRLLLALFTCFFYYEFDQNMMLVGVERRLFPGFLLPVRRGDRCGLLPDPSHRLAPEMGGQPREKMEPEADGKPAAGSGAASRSRCGIGRKGFPKYPKPYPADEGRRQNGLFCGRLFLYPPRLSRLPAW